MYAICNKNNVKLIGGVECYRVSSLITDVNVPSNDDYNYYVDLTNHSQKDEVHGYPQVWYYNPQTGLFVRIITYYYAKIDDYDLVVEVVESEVEITQPNYIRINHSTSVQLDQYYNSTNGKFESLEKGIYLVLKELESRINPIVVGETKTATIPASSQKATIDVTAEVGNPSAYLHTLEILSAVDSGDLEASVTATLNVAQKKMLLARSNMSVTDNIVVTYRINKQSI